MDKTQTKSKFNIITKQLYNIYLFYLSVDLLMMNTNLEISIENRRSRMNKLNASNLY